MARWSSHQNIEINKNINLLILTAALMVVNKPRQFLSLAQSYNKTKTYPVIEHS